MPRLPFSLLRQVHRENPLLVLLLQECRSIDSARNELRWLRECALRDSQSPSRQNAWGRGWRTRLKSMCERRSKGFPLQYILGDQPFGDLEILCKRGVFIPRPDTESYTFHAAKLARRLAVACKQDATLPGKARPLRVIDLCTGTGCIALLLHALLAPHFDRLSVRGLDISPTALKLAQKNLAYNLQRGLLTRRASTDVHFSLADVLGQGDASVPVVEEVLRNCLPRPNMSEKPSPDLGCDLLISNPPYISLSTFRDGTTARSVRRFEPQLALVPPLVDSVDSEGLAGGRPEDIFYHRLITLSFRLRAKVTVLECGDIAQANRVVAMHQAIASGQADAFSAEVWPSTEQDSLANGFHPHDGSRCVVIQRQIHER